MTWITFSTLARTKSRYDRHAFCQNRKEDRLFQFGHVCKEREEPRKDERWMLGNGREEKGGVEGTEAVEEGK